MDGLDQPSTAGATAALPRVGRTIRHHPHACGVRAAASWGANVRGNFEAADLLSSTHNTGRVPARVVHTCPV